MINMNKKGFATAIVDFYATLAIVLIIIIFFVVLHFKTEQSTYNVTGEQIGLDATQIALLYAQTPVETSKGTMTFAEFLVLAAEDEELEEEFETKTLEFFGYEYMEKIQTITSVTIALSRQGNTEEIISYDARDIFTKFSQLCTAPSCFLLLLTSGDDTVIGSGEITIPLPTPGDFSLITVQTYSQ